MKRLSAFLPCMLCLALHSAAAATTITFDDLPLNSSVGYQYAARGVIFPITVGIGPFATGSPTLTPHSGAHVAEVVEVEFESAPIAFDFTSPQSHVSLYGCTAGTNVTGTLKLFDQAHNLVGQVGPLILHNGSCTVLFDFHAGSATIAHGEFSSAVNNAPVSVLYIDDLAFDGGAPPPPVATGTPVIQISAPLNNAQLSASTAAVSGIVQGNGLLPVLQLSVDHVRMNWDQAPPDGYAVQLPGSGPPASFSQTIRLPLGTVKLTATEGNNAGRQGVTTVTFTNLPPQLRSSTLGALTGTVDASPACQVAVYAQGALALSGTSTYSIGPRILPRWVSWVNTARSVAPSSFCPTENAHLVSGVTSRQNFTGGRFYDNTAAIIYVSAVFSQAIDTLGGEWMVGLPLADPVNSFAAHTWQFQRFSRPQGGLLTTIELKGDPTTLSVERQGGDLSVLTAAGLSLAPTTATLVDQFACTGVQGPCAITAPVPSTPRITNPAQICGGKTFPGQSIEWSAVLSGGDIIPTPAMGWVTDSAESNEDYGLTHQFVFEHSDGAIWSDWTLFLHPLPAYNKLLAANSSMEVEIEYYPTSYLFVAYDGQPLAGDLYFVAGRWIIDCGHSDYSSEIHPPFVTSRIRTQGAGDSAQTSALVWVNGYYYSGQPVQVKLYPPPRPTPVSFLAISMPDAALAAYNVNVSGAFDPGATDPDFAAWVMATFSASAKPVTLGYGAELPFAPGRTYAGTWIVGWEKETQYQIQSLGSAWWP
jgi:hypothetical protein